MCPIKTQESELQRENESLRARLEEAQRHLSDAQEVIAAIRSGEVDAVVVSGPEGEQIFTLRGAEAAYRALVEAMNEGAATIAWDGTLLYCNQHLADLIGIPLGQVMGRSIADLIGPDAMETVEPLMARALSGVPAKAEVEMRSALGSPIPTHVSISKMKIEEPTALCMVVTDLTESKKWEDLITAGKLTNSILDSSAEGIAVCDKQGNIRTLNGVLKRLCGSNPILEHFDKAFPLEIEEKNRSRTSFTISSSLNGPVRAQEVLFRRNDGSEFSLLLSSGQIPDDTGNAGCVLTLTDITGRKRVEQALLQSEKLAAVGRLAASIAHEINNPLESVTNLLYLARGAREASEMRDFLGAADRELRRVSLIANQTLRFHKQSTLPTEISCDDLIEGVLSMFQGRFLNSQIQVEKKCTNSRPIRCFEGEIRQVLSNLIGNAIDALHRGGRLFLASKDGHDRAGREGVYLTVADDGPGMSKETLARACEPFFTTKGFSGTGLGLWVSQEIIRRHDGKLRIRSSQRPSKTGTVITIFLPYTPAPRPQAPEKYGG
ncbi:MAG TPA: PAS domain S-box protein [Silvibacterium sp.]|nr:PAS domain S-box protein [Silvibacterium sp.]